MCDPLLKSNYIAQTQQTSSLPSSTVNDISTDLQADVALVPMDSNQQAYVNTNTETHSLLSMLERFVHVETFSWTSDDKVLPLSLSQENYIANTPTSLRTYELPQSLIDNSNLIRQKLNNFMLLKADIEIDIKVNSTPFQQGALMAAYFPRTLNTSKFRAKGNEYMAGVTSSPHRILYLEQGNSLTFRVPYAHILDWINLTDTNDTFGSLHLYALSPLQGETTNEQVDVSVRLRFADLELSVPTDNSIMQQSQYRQMEIDAMVKSHDSTSLGLIAQIAEGEVEGPVTKISNTVVAAGEALSSVPVIGTAAKIVTWFARGVSGIATVFGWSKPIDLTMPSSVVARPAAYMGNTEGKDCSAVLAQIPDNSIDSSTMVPSNSDELSHAAILAQPNIIGRYRIPIDSFTTGNLLFSWEVSPINSLHQQIASNGQDFALGSIGFLASMYKFWRGSMNYSLSVIKTQYHSARIIAVYFPNRTRSSIPATYNELMTTNSNVLLDIDAKDDMENALSTPIVIPYTSAEPWKRTLYKNENFLYDQSTMNTHIGCVGIYCYSKLVAPPAVSQEVTFLLHAKTGDDFELGLPQIQMQAGFAPTETVDPVVNLVAKLNEVLAGDLTMDAAGVSDYTNINFPDQGGMAIDMTTTAVADYACMQGIPVSVPDGDYTPEVTVTLDPDYFFGSTYTFTLNVTILDGFIYSMTSNRTPVTSVINDADTMTMTFSVPSVHRECFFKAQIATADDLPNEELIAPSRSTSEVSRGTTGEYAKSLRPLIKRFVLTRYLDPLEPISLTPADFINYDSATPTLPVGNRAWASETASTGALVPESWLNLVSYLYRFFAGSVRTKIFIGHDVEATSSLEVTDSLYTEFSNPQSDPAFVTNGSINNAVETSIPYYSQYRARTVGDQVKGIAAKQRFAALDSSRIHAFYEAGGDDANFWFMIGPPIMRPVDVSPVSVPTIAST